ncbi:MAG: hypothetical protein AB1416_08445 [Actinomycetota bacterium]
MITPGRGRLRPPGWALVAVLAIGLLVALPAGGSSLRAASTSPALTPKLVGVTPDGPPIQGCTSPTPAGAGTASATLTSPAVTIQTEWSVPGEITAGAGAFIHLQVTPVAGQGHSGFMAIKTPSEFGLAPSPNYLEANVPPGGTPFNQRRDFTFTPQRAFTAGETLYIRLENGCTAFTYKYVVSGTSTPPATPKPPRLTPRSVPPTLGETTSYAAPRPGVPVAIPFPPACAAGRASNARAKEAPAGGECSVDIFLRRKGADPIYDPAGTFAVDLEVSDKNFEKAEKICFATSIGQGGFRLSEYLRCVITVARILQRAEDLARQRNKPLEYASHAGGACRFLNVPFRPVRGRTSPVRVTCRRLGAGMRITMRSARAGKPVASLIGPASRLLVARSHLVPARPGDRIDVRWTAVAPRTSAPQPTPTPPTPAPPTPPGAQPTTKVALTSVEAFPNPRTSNDLPANAIDGSTSTFTWTTESYNVVHPSYLAVGFANATVGRLRLWKQRDGGGGQLVKNLTIQYTTGTGPLSSRTWTTVTGLANGFAGAETLRATAVNADGTVTGDVHDSPSGDGYASLTFTPVQATGLRIAFANPDPATTCSSVPGTCNHYRVGELEVYALPG